MPAGTTNPTLQESIAQVMQTLPPFIREYLLQSKYTPVARGLMSKYQLRIDQGNVLERELMLLLMGIENPTEFTKALIEEGRISQETVNNLVKDINAQVFIPLRKQEEELSKNKASQQIKPVVPSVPARPTAFASQQRPAAPSPHIAPLPPKMAMPIAKGSLADAVRKAIAPKSVDAERLLADHEEPHMELTATAPAPVPAKPESAAPIIEPAPPLPKTPSSVPPVAPVAQPTTPTPAMPPLTPKAPPPPPITSYSADPYREPIDEK
jgi:hypothetical protein